MLLQIASGDIEVPLVLGVDEISARNILTQAGFLITQLEAYDPSQDLGIVLAQTPDAATTATIGSSITITVNRQQ